MELYDYELDLQSEIVCWKCSRYADCLIKFIPKPRHLKLGMSGLLWSIEALPLQRTREYSFNIMTVKRSRTPLSLSEAAAPDLPAKFKLLLVGFEVSMKSVCRAVEALDKLYAFSRLFLRAYEDNRWRIILDAEIMATACNDAREAIYQAAQAAAGFLVDQIDDSPVFRGSQESKRRERSGWWIDKWTVADELWATTSFFPPDNWNAMIRLIQARAVERGNVVQWCKVQLFDKPNPYFHFEVAVEEFLEGDDALLRIGVANDRALMVEVFLTEAVDVFCFQEGVKPQTSLGLTYLLPGVVRDYIRSALAQNEAKLTSNNVVEGLLQHLIRYLTFLRGLCVICGSNRCLEVPLTSACSNICKARKKGYEAAIAGWRISEAATTARREQFVRKLYDYSAAGKSELLKIRACGICMKEVQIDKSENLTGYDETIRIVAKLKSRSIAKALGVPISQLWINDTGSFERFSGFW
ncbi:hypothetical protein SUGI_0466860 [Cryptomeria japonica]|nr:hypothetical protein SUGI_0466860 [Cryptomeria japonica]